MPSEQPTPLRPRENSADSDSEAGSTPFEISTAPLGGISIPGYELLEPLGRGGMGVVFKARHRKLNRLVAIKVLPNAEFSNAETLARFLAEAQAVAAVKHPNVIEVYDFGEVNRSPYFVMELLEPDHFGKRFSPKDRHDPREVARVLAKVARGVAEVHAERMVHRDLKPANILFDKRAEPKVVNFGLAKRENSELTKSGATFGTLYYMAPEQAGGKTKFAGPPADVWALGVILYECLTGRRPFDGDDQISLLLSIATDEPPAPRSVNADVPPELEAIIHTCLAKQPEGRYATAKELAQELERYGSQLPTVEPIQLVVASDRKRNWSWLRWVVSLSVLIVGGLGVTFWPKGEPKSEAAKAEAVKTEPPEKLATEPATNLNSKPVEKKPSEGLSNKKSPDQSLPPQPAPVAPRANSLPMPVQEKPNASDKVSEKIPGKSVLIVTMPQDDAELMLNNKLTKQTGTVRMFEVNTLDPNTTYEYELTTKFKPNNFTTITRKKDVRFQGSDATVAVDLSKGDAGDRVVIRYVPTPEDVVKEMMKLGNVGQEDVVYDLGCGDGRIVIAAVRDAGAKRGVGIDLDPVRVQESNEGVKKAKLEGKVEIRQGDVLDVKDLSDATVVMLYMGDELGKLLEPKLRKALKPGARVVSHRFLLGDWKPDRTIVVVAKDGEEFKLHLWTVPAAESKK